MLFVSGNVLTNITNYTLPSTRYLQFPYEHVYFTLLRYISTFFPENVALIV